MDSPQVSSTAVLWKARIAQSIRGIHRLSFAGGFFLTLLFGIGYLMFFQGADSTSISTSVVVAERRSIVTSVKATGTVSFAREQQMKFNQRGRVTAVNVSEGDTVKKGQVLAELDKSSVGADLRQAQLSLSTSALQLKELEADRENQLLSAQNSVKNAEQQFIEAQNDLVVAQTKLPFDVEAAKRDVEQKQNALTQAQANELQRLASVAQSLYSDSQDLIDTLYGVLVNDTSARRAMDQKTVEIYFRLYNDYSLKNTVEFSYYDALNAVSDMGDAYGGSLTAVRDPVVIAGALQDGHAAALLIQQLANDMYAMLQGANEDPRTFTVSDINAVKQTVLSARDSAAGLSDDADAALASIIGRKNVTSIAVKSAEDALQKSEEALAVLEAQTPGNLQSQEAAMQKMQDDYRTQAAKADSTTKSVDIQIQLKRNDIAQKSAALLKSSKTLEDYEIIAPFDGVVRRVDYQVGDNLLADVGEDQYIVLENPEFIVVSVLLDQTDVVRVQEGMSAGILFDALPDQAFVGAIHEISPTPVEQSGVVSYEVKVKLPTPENVTVLSGMTAVVTIETSRQDNVVAVPNLAISRTDNRATVQLSDGQTVPVQTGATDGRYTEVVSGLEEGDQVLAVNVQVGSSAQQAGAANTNSAQQLMRASGGFTGGGGANLRRQ